MSHLNWDKAELKSIMGDMLFPDDKTSNATSTIFILGHILTMRAELKGLCILIKGEKLLLRGTLAPKNGRNRYGLGTPVPNTWRKQFIKKNVILILASKKFVLTYSSLSNCLLHHLLIHKILLLCNRFNISCNVTNIIIPQHTVSLSSFNLLYSHNSTF